MAATGIEHVVVVMFENRSFDHLLGLLSDDPAYPGVRLDDEDFSNPVDPTRPEKGRIRVTGDATVGDWVDPPHSHASVMEQLGLARPRPVLAALRGRSSPAMDGFVAAYSRKLAGDEAGLPIVHWRRIHAACAATSLFVGLVLALPWRRPLVTGGLGLVAALEAGVAAVHRRRRVLPVHSWTRPFAAPPVAVVAGGLASLVLARWMGYKRRVAVIATGLTALCATTTSRKRRQLTEAPSAGDEAGHVLRCMRPWEQLPALATLASSFALCTRWHCSVPGATWPNRNFAHAGTSDGSVDIEPGLYDTETIFQRLQEAGRSWSIYRDRRSMAQAMAFGWLSDDGQIGRWRTLDQFGDDVAAGRLATYSFIEPCHDGPSSNSQHPGNNERRSRPAEGDLWDFERGENLLIEVYEALRRNPELFAKTVLVVTYDEHGGLYDHVPPPTDAVEPEPLGTRRSSWSRRLFGWFVQQPDSRFRFTVLGPRVPTVVVSPRVAQRWDDTGYDHTAIPRTLRALFAPSAPPLSAREEACPSFDGLVSLEEPRTDLPDLSRFLKVPARGVAADAAPTRDDEFARQLQQLGPLLRPKLQRGTRSRSAADQDVATLFTARAEAAVDAELPAPP